jgi:hypothetical protein
LRGLQLSGEAEVPEAYYEVVIVAVSAA